MAGQKGQRSIRNHIDATRTAIHLQVRCHLFLNRSISLSELTR